MHRSVISRIRPHLKWINQARYLRPTVQIAKDRFILTMDVRNFFKDEINVKAKPEYVVIEGKQERKCKNGLVLRQFVRKFKLPEGCSPNRMETRLSENGVLTIIAHRSTFDQPGCCESGVPIKCLGAEENPCCVPNPCCPPPSPQPPVCQDDGEVKIVVQEEKKSCNPDEPKPT